MPSSSQVAIIGAGPAGLGAAHGLAGRGLSPLVLEKTFGVGGICRSEEYGGHLFDLGGHRFFTDLPEIQGLWDGLLGQDLLRVERRSGIYYQGVWFRYPLDFADVLAKLGWGESIMSVLSFLAAKVKPVSDRRDLESWLIHNFGRRLYARFFKRYTEKIWGRPCHEIEADWADQRIPGLSLAATLAHALGRSNNQARTLTSQFYYPRLGAGMMWDRLRENLAAQGTTVHLGREVTGLRLAGRRLSELRVKEGAGETWLPVEQVISTISLPQLVGIMDPLPPPEVTRAARQLGFRAFLEVGLIVEQEELFPDQWLYIHDPQLRVGRIQNFKNWSPFMAPLPGRCNLGMEYFCDTGEPLWSLPDAEVIALASRELDALWPGLGAKVRDGVVFRVSHAYPIYHLGYQEALGIVQGFLGTLENLQSIGRNGQHRYNNLDHSMLSGLEAARSVAERLQGPA
jgi:protoporphyrinogen oxidase